MKVRMLLLAAAIALTLLNFALTVGRSAQTRVPEKTLKGVITRVVPGHGLATTQVQGSKEVEVLVELGQFWTLGAAPSGPGGCGYSSPPSSVGMMAVGQDLHLYVCLPRGDGTGGTWLRSREPLTASW